MIQVMASGITNKCRLSGDDRRLPTELRKLGARYVDVDSSRVYMLIDTAACYGIAWERDEQDTNVWKLIVYGSAPGDVVYTNEKLPGPSDREF